MYAGLVAVAILVCSGFPVPSTAIAAGALIQAAFLSLFVFCMLKRKNRARATSYAIFLEYRFCSLNVLGNLRFDLYLVTF